MRVARIEDRPDPAADPASELGPTVRIVVVDDHALFVDALARRIDAEPAIELVGRAASGAEAREILARTAPDVAVIDVELGADDGLALVEGVLGDGLAGAVVVATAHETVDVAARALRVGALGFVSKGERPDDLIDAIRTVHQGRSRLPVALATAVAAELDRLSEEQRELGRRLEGLTVREREVLALLAAGADRSAIAGELFVSTHTVRTHVQRILGKLGVHSQLEAVSVALRAGLRRPQGPPPGKPNGAQPPG